MSLRRDLAIDLVEKHPDEAAVILESLDATSAAGFLAGLPVETAAQVLRRITAHPAAALLERLPPERAAAIGDRLPVDVASTYLRHLPAAARQRIIALLEPARARSLSTLLRFPDDTAGALMDPEVLALPLDLTVREAVERVRASARHARYNVYVVDRDDRLVGALNLRELLLAKPRNPITGIMHGEVMQIAAETDWRGVVAHPGWREVHSLPVVDRGGTYLGAIRYRTLRRLEARMHEQRPESDLTARALGELFWTGVSGVVGALAGGSSAPPRRADPEDVAARSEAGP